MARRYLKIDELKMIMDRTPVHSYQLTGSSGNWGGLHLTGWVVGNEINGWVGSDFDVRCCMEQIIELEKFPCDKVLTIDLDSWIKKHGLNRNDFDLVGIHIRNDELAYEQSLIDGFVERVPFGTEVVGGYIPSFFADGTQSQYASGTALVPKEKLEREFIYTATARLSDGSNSGVLFTRKEDSNLVGELFKECVRKMEGYRKRQFGEGRRRQENTFDMNMERIKSKRE